MGSARGIRAAGLPSSRGGGVGVVEAESPSDPEEDSSSVRHSGVESDQPPSVGGVADVDGLTSEDGELDQCSRISSVKGPGQRASAAAASNAAIVAPQRAPDAATAGSDAAAPVKACTGRSRLLSSKVLVLVRKGVPGRLPVELVTCARPRNAPW